MAIRQINTEFQIKVLCIHTGSCITIDGMKMSRCYNHLLWMFLVYLLLKFCQEVKNF